MSGPKKDKLKLSEQGVVTEEALVAYLHNELSTEEKQELEKLLLQDPFAAGALEGLKSSANQTAVTTSMHSLKKKVRERSGIKERKKLQLHWVTYAWAASIVGLLIGISFIMINFLNKTDHSLAMNDKDKAPVVQPKDTASAYEKSNEKATDSSKAVVLNLSDSVATPSGAVTFGGTQNNPSAPVKSGTLNVQSNGTASATYTVTTTNGVTTNLSTAKKTDTKNDDKNTVKYKASADSVSVATYSWTAASPPNTKAEANKKEQKAEVKDLGALQDDAMKSFNSADYNTAGDDFDKILKSEPDNADALYFGGISDYINGKTAKSENNFDKLLKKGNKYTEGAKWYKANILLKKGKSDAAKVLLQDLSNGSSSYKERAIKKLAEMGF